jgi:antitoxin VapB
MTATAKVFMSGRSQAVRLPKEFRFDVDEVQIERTKDGILLRTKTKLELFREYVAKPGVGNDFLVDRNAGLKDDTNRPDPFADWTDKNWADLEARRSSTKNAKVPPKVTNRKKIA